MNRLLHGTLQGIVKDHAAALAEFEAVAAALAAGSIGRLPDGARNVVLLRPRGTGKTHLATGLGIAAANHGHRVLFPTGSPDSPSLTAPDGSRTSSRG